MMVTKSVKQKILLSLQMGRALRLVRQSAPGWTMANLALAIVQGLLALLLLYLMKLTVDGVTAGLVATDKIEAFGRVLLLIGVTGAATLLSSLCNTLSALFSEKQSLVVTDYVHSMIQAKSVAVDLEFYENAQYYDTLQRAQGEGYRSVSIVTGLVQLSRNCISLLAMAGLLFSFHWIFAIILFITVMPGILVRLKYANKMYRWQRERTSVERKAYYFHWLLTGDMHAKEVRLFDLGNLFIGRFRDLRQLIRRERLRIATKRSLAELTAQIGATVAALGSYAFFAYRTVYGSITLGDMIMYYQAFQRGQSYLKELLGSLAALYEDNLFLSNLYEFLDLKPKVVEPHYPIPVPKIMQTGIVFDHVNFQYPSGARKVLEDVTFAIRPGEKVALVGENGEGKTTLIKLMCRLYDPSSGKITIDGVDLRDFKISELRQQISVIFQDYAKYHLTARENIWFGNINLALNDEKIYSSARLSGADDIIDRLPAGYETILGKWFEDGEELSIGEWQKIALARAYLNNSQIIVLDEPTSSMDAKAEYEVFQNFHRLAEGKTAILISHRFSTVRMADRIYVLNGGRIKESGAHDELLQRGGMYARLFETQAQYYK
ncbi:ABC transporter ATP-binding protein [candidate division KSB1 bacterium]|nr:ABC transporter ATP-binding protein [candidate division KSB1 bacterium]